MRTAATLIATLILFLAAQGPAAPAPAPASTIEQCAKLLPKGKQYAFGINGTIDYSGATPVVHGELTLTDPTNADLTQLGGPFAQCFSRLVR